jgi:hypothetical protein
MVKAMAISIAVPGGVYSEDRHRIRQEGPVQSGIDIDTRMELNRREIAQIPPNIGNADDRPPHGHDPQPSCNRYILMGLAQGIEYVFDRMNQGVRGWGPATEGIALHRRFKIVYLQFNEGACGHCPP